MKKCNICGNDKFAYRYFKKELVPICDDCYEEYIAKQNRYELLMARLTAKKYMWIVGIGKANFPYTLFGLDVKLEDIISFIISHLGDDFSFHDQDSSSFQFKDYEIPIIVERNLTFKNDKTHEYVDVNIRMGIYNFDNDSVLFFTDKQQGLKESDLNSYSSVIYGNDGIYRLEAYDYDNYDRFTLEDDINQKEYLNDDDLRSLLGQ